jgi:multicomponent Na+:H+ antiporter subunit F
MASAEFLDLAVQIAMAVLAVSFLVTVFKVIHGPTLPDRILALDMLVGIAIGFLAVIGIKTGYTLYLDIAIALGLVGFLATVAFARFILARGRVEESEEVETTPVVMAEAGAVSPGEAVTTVDLDVPGHSPDDTRPGGRES